LWALQQFSFAAACHLFMSAKQDQHFFVVVFGINTHMQINEVVSATNTPEQHRIASLKSAKDRAGDALEAERQRQKVSKAQRSLQQARQLAVKSATNP
jgi:hypothetical protein